MRGWWDLGMFVGGKEEEEGTERKGKRWRREEVGRERGKKRKRKG